MMGFQSVPERLFYDFCLEDHVPDDHLLRRIDAHLAGNHGQVRILYVPPEPLRLAPRIGPVPVSPHDEGRR